MGTVYVLENGQPKPVRVSVGITDNRMTEVWADEIKEGACGHRRRSPASRQGVRRSRDEVVLMDDHEHRSVIRIERLYKEYVTDAGTVPVLKDVAVYGDAGGVCRHHGAVRFRQVHLHEYSRLPRCGDQRQLLFSMAAM